MDFFLSPTEVAIVALALVLVIVHNKHGSSFDKKHLPPGPQGIPFFGNLFQVNALRSYPQVCSAPVFILTQNSEQIIRPSFVNGHQSMAQFFTFVLAPRTLSS